MSVLGAQTFQVQKWPAGGFASDAERRRGDAPPAAHARERRRHPRAGRRSVDLVGSEIWDFGFVVAVQGRVHEPEHLDRAAARPSTRRTTRTTSGSAATSRRWTCGAAAKVAVIGYAIAKKLFPFVGPDRARRPRGRAQVPRGRRVRREEVGLRRELRQLRADPGHDVPQRLRAHGPRRLRALGQHHRAGEDARADGRRDRADAPGPAARARRQAGRGGQLRLLQQRRA